MLTEIECKNLRCPPDKKRVRLSDSGGLYLEAGPSGSLRWFWKYYFGGKEKRLALGRYPTISLKQARLARDEARLLHAKGIDPAMKRQEEKLFNRHQSSNTFEAVARELHEIKRDGWSEKYATRWLERLEKDVFPWIGAMPVDKITAPILLQVLRRIERRGAIETAHTLRQTTGQVFRYAIATGRCERNPSPDLHGALKPVTTKNMAAVLEPARAGELLRAMDGYTGQPVTRVAMLLSALTFQRPGNVRMMEWEEVDLQDAMWTIPSVKMKRTKQEKLNGRPHLVPLAKQAVKLLQEIYPLTGGGKYVFPALTTKARPMSENTVRLALRRMSFSNEEMTAHGFRAMARTMLVEQLDANPDVIEAQLAHNKSGPLGAAYDRAQFLTQRRKLMQQWADYLDELRQGAQVIEFRKA
ncbi:integrase [Lampropedia cohaerens]|uniref:Integrase n=1 Tax=Lampropedia cohaerens TaxID=1610491 RepID=A0A0U1PWV6_9BURK|nr:integrase arm-type DNA-binding domain-containing protein [Lampropedia cohaerens]KKW66936.1 integrase [Lampropedia cohaerens]